VLVYDRWKTRRVVPSGARVATRFFRLCCGEEERGPGWLIGVTTPGPRCAAPGKGSVQALYACLPERCLVPREGAIGGDAGAGVPALQL
jgi:hypothetical protein